MFQTLDQPTADLLWQKAIKWFTSKGIANNKNSRNGDTTEVLHVGLSIADPRQRWIASRTPTISPAFAIAETIWILNGRNDSRFLNFFNPALPKYQGTGETFHGAYGHRLRKHFNHDQLESAYNALRSDPTSRQVVLQIWDSKCDLPVNKGSPRNKDIPCNISSILRISDGCLEWTQIMRSNDIFRGLPYNIVQFTTIHEVLAGWLEVKLGSYNHLSDSLHAYSSDGDPENMILPRRTYPNEDDLRLSKSESEGTFQKLSEFGDLLIENSSLSLDIEHEIEVLRLPVAYSNLMRILAADSVRRHGCPDRSKPIIEKCTNLCLRDLYSSWSLRFN